MNIFKRYAERKEKRELIGQIRETAKVLLKETRRAGIFSGARYEYKDEIFNIELECVMPFTMMTNEIWLLTIDLSSGERVFEEKWEGLSFVGRMGHKNKLFVEGSWINHLHSLV